VTAPTQHLAGFVVEVPATSQLLTAATRKVSRSISDASPASDDGSNAVRFAELERKQAKLEKRVSSVELTLKKLAA
jgi:hypothetical protein